MSKTQESEKKLGELVSRAADPLDADLILFTGPLSRPSDETFIRQVSEQKPRKNVVLLVTTLGGAADVAYRMCRCIRRTYTDGKFILLVDWYCKSAGTLLAVGADEIILSDRGELGPLDVQLSKPDELFESMSGLSAGQALMTLRSEALECFEQVFLALRTKSSLQITTRTAADIAVKITTGLFGRVYEQIDPLRLGENELAMQIAWHYGTRLANKNLKEDALESLIQGYPSHGFVIDLREAQRLFESARSPSQEESDLVRFLRPYVEKRFREASKSGTPVVDFLVPIADETKQADDDGTGQESGATETGRGSGPPPRSSEKEALGPPQKGDGAPSDRGREATEEHPVPDCPVDR
ncbi:MAG: hypothetical protein ACYTEZ_16360 [Planctomycetota bacterium]|jgi:hypothetical protein